MTDAKNRSKILLTGLLILVLVLGSYFLLISPKKTEASDTLEELDQVEFRNSQLQTEVNRLRAQEAQLPEVWAKIAELQVQVPASAEFDSYLMRLNELAELHEVFISTVSVSIPQQVTLINPEVPSTQAPESTVAPTPDPSVSEDPAEATEETPAATTPQSDTIPGFFNLRHTYELIGAPVNVLAFLQAVQVELPRFANLPSLSIQVSIDDQPATGGRPAITQGDFTVGVVADLFVYAPVDVPVDPNIPVPEATPPAPLPVPTVGKNPYIPLGG